MFEKQNSIQQLASDVKDLVDLRMDEFKLKSVKALSSSLSVLCSVLLIAGVAIIALGLLAYALLQWLNALLGEPWGTLIVFGVFAIVLAFLVASRRGLFRDSFVKLFSESFFSPDDDE